MSAKPNHPEQKDNFSQIRGIGSGIERRLHDAYVHTFADMAAKTPAELAVILKGLPGITKNSPQLITWIRQAGELAGQPVESSIPLQEPGALIEDTYEFESQARNENFTVVLRVGEDNRVHRTRVMHMQDAAERAWAGWDGQQLLKFIHEHAGLQDATPVSAEWLAGDNPPTATEEMETPAPVRESTPVGETSPTPARGNINILKMEVATVDRSNPGSVMKSGQAFKVCLGLNMSQVEAASGTVFYYSAEIFARNLNTHVHQKVGDGLGEVRLAESAVIEVAGQPMPAGVYRMEAVVMLSPGSLNNPHGKRIAFLDGGIFQVT